MSELKQTMQRAKDFIAANLADCCRDELTWQDTGLLSDGKLREASEIYALVEDAHAMPMAQAEVARQAMQQACRAQPSDKLDARDQALEEAAKFIETQRVANLMPGDPCGHKIMNAVNNTRRYLAVSIRRMKSGRASNEAASQDGGGNA